MRASPKIDPKVARERIRAVTTAVSQHRPVTLEKLPVARAEEKHDQVQTPAGALQARAR